MMFRKLILILALPLVFSSAAIAETGDHYLKEGIVAFKEGRYQDAVAYFNRAKQKGMASSNVSYNIGASYYKMNQYRQAKTAFMDAAKNEKYQKFSWYNLGLVERKLGNKEEALKWFRKTLKAKGSRKVDALANQMIQQLAPESATTQSSPKDSRDSRDIATPDSKPSSSLTTSGDKFAKLETGLGYAEYVATLALDRKDKRRRSQRVKRARKVRGGIDLAYGNDDDVIDANDNTSTGLSSNYVELFAYVDIPLGKSFTLTGDIYNQQFPDVSSEDFRVFKFGIHYTTKIGDLKVTPSLIYGQSKFDSTDYQDITDFRVKVVKRLGKGKKFQFRFRHSDIEAGDPTFIQYEGDRQQFRFEYKTRASLGKWRFRYQLETNDRNNTPTRDYSPTRHDFRARLKQKLFGGSYELGTEVQYRISNYDGIASGASQGFEREDDRVRFKLDFNKRINKQWKVGFLWVHTDNDSNSAGDEYSKNDVQIYTSWTF